MRFLAPQYQRILLAACVCRVQYEAARCLRAVCDLNFILKYKYFGFAQRQSSSLTRATPPTSISTPWHRVGAHIYARKKDIENR